MSWMANCAAWGKIYCRIQFKKRVRNKNIIRWLYTMVREWGISADGAFTPPECTSKRKRPQRAVAVSPSKQVSMRYNLQVLANNTLGKITHSRSLRNLDCLKVVLNLVVFSVNWPISLHALWKKPHVLNVFANIIQRSKIASSWPKAELR